MGEIKIQKSALANHFTKLKNSYLIEKVQYGTYRLTDYGNKHLEYLELAFKESKMRRKQIEDSKQRLEMTKSFLEKNRIHYKTEYYSAFRKTNISKIIIGY